MIGNYHQAVPLSEPISYVEYIQSNGNQYIDTGFKPNQNTRVVADYQFEKVLANVWQGLFGARGSSSQSYSTPFALFLSPRSIHRSDFNDTVNFSSILNPTARHLIDKNKNSCTIDSFKVTNSLGSFQRDNTMYLFACQSGTLITEKAYAKIYSLKIYDNGTLIRDYLPALDPEGVACLYDKVNKTYAYNVGSGSFTAGSLL